MKAPKLKKTTIYFPEAVHKEIKTEAAQRGISISDLLIEALAARPTALWKQQPAPDAPKA